MQRWLLIAVSVALFVPVFAAQDLPKVSLVLPPGSASETVQVNYFLAGSFGGYGGFVKPEPRRETYDIEPFVNGRAAAGIKVIAYIPGCEILAFALTSSGTSIERRLHCRPLGSIPIEARILDIPGTREQNLQIEVNYVATWSHQFFGISDGAVTTIRLASVPLHADGSFSTTLPDLYQQPRLRNGELEFILRSARTGNIIAFLKPADAAPNAGDWVHVQASYPVLHLSVRTTP
jgi:hypothetical protein